MSRFARLQMFGAAFLVLCALRVGLADDGQPSAPTAPNTYVPAPAAEMPAAEKPPVISPAQAKENMGKVVTVEFTVAESKELPEKSLAFLNSEKDMASPTNFTVFINTQGYKAFKEEGKITDPAGYFRDKKIRVTGTIVDYKGKTEIIVKKPSQIELPEEPKS